MICVSNIVLRLKEREMEPGLRLDAKERNGEVACKEGELAYLPVGNGGRAQGHQHGRRLIVMKRKTSHELFW